MLLPVDTHLEVKQQEVGLKQATYLTGALAIIKCSFVVAAKRPLKAQSKVKAVTTGMSNSAACPKSLLPLPLLQQL